MKIKQDIFYKYDWKIFPIVFVVHQAALQLTLLCGITAENIVIVWLPNAVLLAILLRFKGQRIWQIVLICFCSDVIGNAPYFGWLLSMQLGCANVIEVIVTYVLLRRANASADLNSIDDFRKFIVAGPILAALLGGVIGAAIIKMSEVTTTPYFSCVLIWWFGDALGLMIFTPLLLMLTNTNRVPIVFNRIDAMIALLLFVLSALIFLYARNAAGDLLVNPNLMLPIILVVALRFGPLWTVVSVAVCAMSISAMVTFGYKLFGNVSLNNEIIYAQSHILTLSIVGMGCAIFLNELISREHFLEQRVSQRTQELEDSNRKLAALSATDGLTGIANRRCFDDELASEWRRASRSCQSLALLLLDVDHFKKFNDLYDHQAGDDCLRMIAKILEASSRRKGDLAARYGGEEFALIVPMVEGDNAEVMAQLICSSVEQLGLPHAKSSFNVVTVSIGVAVIVPDQTIREDVLIHLADDALYQAKRLGRNQVVLTNMVNYK